MARSPGSEDQAGFKNNEYYIAIDDSDVFRLSSTAAVLPHPIMTASISVTVLSASIATGAITSTQHVVLADASSAEIGLTLPTVATVIGRSYTIKKIDDSANAVLVSGSVAAATINGSVFQTLDSENETLTVVSDGTYWHVTAFFSASAGV